MNAFSFFDNPQCKTFAENIDNRIRTYGDNKDLQVRRFQDIKLDLLILSRDLKKQGYNTANLDTDLKEIDTKTNKMSDQYTSLKTTLEKAKTLDCQKDKTEIESLLKTARNSVFDLKNSSNNLKSYYQTEIKTDLIELQKNK